MSEIMMPMGDAPKHSVWDNYVPIITSGRRSTIYLTDTIEAPSEYNETCHLIEHAYKGDEVYLKINNGGGYVDSGFMMVNSFRRSKATIVGQLSGTVASVATILALSCDKLEIDDYVSFMIHNYSGGAQGKGHEVKAQMEFTDKQLNTAFTEIYGGFLTPDEMKQVIDGTDIWMGKTELLARLAARKSGNVETLEAIAAERKG